MPLSTGLFQTRLFRSLTATALLSSTVLLASPPSAQAGCGCTKAPPAPAQVRPHATFAGTEVTLFASKLKAGRNYTITFTSGITGESASLQAEAVSRRDLADGAFKPQLNVALPELPLGPTSVQVRRGNSQNVILDVDDSALTVVPQPFSLPGEAGHAELANFQAAVSRDGTVYLSLDLTGLHHPRTFRTQAQGYPLRFTHDDVIFYNVQGFVMQLLEEGMPGLFAVSAASGMDGDILQYSRHEFNTYFLQHGEVQPHPVDETDENWHADGTPHINHNHLVVAIAATLEGGSLPVPGATPAFDLLLDSHTLFHYGLVGDTAIQMNSKTKTYAYDSRQGPYVPDSAFSGGDIRSNGMITLTDQAKVDGDATGFAFNLSGSAHITGEPMVTDQVIEPLLVDIPKAMDNLGSVALSGLDSLTLVGPASYQVADLALSGQSQLIIDNTVGPVTLYVTGAVLVTDEAVITAADPDPEKFALYVMGPGPVALENKSNFYGVLYAPESLVTINSKADFFGAFVGYEVILHDQAKVYYDIALRGEHDHDTDATSDMDIVQLTKAEYKKNGKLTVLATSTATSDANLTVTIAGFGDNIPMTYKPDSGRYEYKTTTDINLDGADISVVSDFGDSASTVIQ